MTLRSNSIKNVAIFLCIFVSACGTVESDWSRPDGDTTSLQQDFLGCQQSALTKVPANMVDVSEPHWTEPENKCEVRTPPPETHCDASGCQTTVPTPETHCEIIPPRWVTPPPDYVDQNSDKRNLEFVSCMKQKGYATRH